MSNVWYWVILAVVVAGAIAVVAGLLVARKRRISLAESERDERLERKSGGERGEYQTSAGIALAPGGTETAPEHPVEDRPETDGQPGVGEDAAVPRDEPRRSIADVTLPEDTAPDTAPPVTEPDEIPAPAEPVEPTESTEPAEPAEPAEPTAPPQHRRHPARLIAPRDRCEPDWLCGNPPARIARRAVQCPRWTAARS